MHKLVTPRFALPTIVILTIVTIAIVAVAFSIHTHSGSVWLWPS